MPESKTVLFLSNHFITLYFFRRELIERLVSRGHRVVLSMPDDERISYFSDLGCEIVVTPMSRRGLNPVEDLKLLRQYRSILRRVKPDVIFSYTSKPDIYGSLASNALGYRQVCNITGLGSSLVYDNLLAKTVRALYRVSIRKCYKVFFQNSGNKDYFVRYHIVKDNWDLLPGSGVNLEQHALTPMPDDGEIRFLYSGRIMAVKGIDNLLDCAKAVREKHPETRFYLAGFIEQEKLRAPIEAAQKAGYVEYLGFQKDIDSWIRRCHCTILPSLGGEGVPNAVLESAATGRACIVSDIDGSRDAVDDGVTGYLFRPGDSADLIDKVERFLALSKAEREQMGLAGHEKAAREYPTGAVKMGALKLLHAGSFSGPALCQVSPRAELTVDRGARLSIGSGFKMRPGAVLRVRRGAVCRIGKNVSFNLNNMLACQEAVTLGDDVILSPNVQIYDHDHDYRAEGGVAAMKYKTSPVVIGSNVWIGANCVILRGTHIGDNCVIGAGCVLRGDIPANSVVTQERKTEIRIREVRP